MTPLGWTDVLRVLWWWGSKGKEPTHVWKLTEEGDFPGHKRLILINKNWSHPRMIDGNWGTTKSLITKAKRIAVQTAPEFQIERVEIETLEPHVAMPWTTGLKDELVVYIPLHCHYPKFILYEDIQAIGLIPGQVWAVGANNAQRTIANYGEVQSVCLVLTLRREAEE